MAERREENPNDPREEEPRTRTERGYDEAAHSGPSHYGDFEGRGGVFGTTGGGTYGEGFETYVTPELTPGGSPFDPEARDRDYMYARRSLPYSEVSYTERGPHTGRGPRGYTRSDDRVLEEVNDQLWLDGNIDASEIVVTVDEGEVTLTGSVPERRMKRAAAEVVGRVGGVREVFNQLRVLPR